MTRVEDRSLHPPTKALRRRKPPWRHSNLRRTAGNSITHNKPTISSFNHRRASINISKSHPRIPKSHHHAFFVRAPPIGDHQHDPSETKAGDHCRKTARPQSPSQSSTQQQVRYQNCKPDMQISRSKHADEKPKNENRNPSAGKREPAKGGKQ